MQTETEAGEAKAGGKKQRVQDEFGGIYELKSKLAEGGQGIVLSTDFQNLLVKVSRWPDGDPRTQAWRKQVEALQRMPVVDEGLPVVMPKARIVKPRAGYVMELVDGLIPLELLLKESIESFASGMGLQGFVSSGGLARRLRVLARLARVLAQLHGLGLAHGDISPKNVFVSTSHDQGEVWLIDCDNLTYAVRDSSLQVYTPDYGAPEILRGDAGISTYTDVWSFAVIAFQLLVQLHQLARRRQRLLRRPRLRFRSFASIPSAAEVRSIGTRPSSAPSATQSTTQALCCASVTRCTRRLRSSERMPRRQTLG